MTIGLGREARRMRALNYSAAARRHLPDSGSVRANIWRPTLPARTGSLGLGRGLNSIPPAGPLAENPACRYPASPPDCGLFI